MKKNRMTCSIICITMLSLLVFSGCRVEVSEEGKEKIRENSEVTTDDAGQNEGVIEKLGVQLNNLDLDGTLNGQYEGLTLTIPVMSGDFEAAVNAAVPIFEELSGAKVIVESIPGEQFMDKVQLDLNNTNRYDIVLAPIAFLHGFAEANKIMELQTYIDEYASESYDVDDFLDGLYNTYGMYKGNLYALPYKPDVEMLFYRKDLFEDEKIKDAYEAMYNTELKVPETNEEMIQVAEFFTESYNSESPIQYGYVNMMMKGSTRLLWINRGAEVIGSDLKPAFNNEAGIKALSDSYKLQDYAPKEWLQMGWTEANTFFANGNAAMMEQWPGLWNTCNAEESPVKGKIGVAITPGRTPCLGGWGIGINSNTKQEELAWKFVEFLTSKDGELLKIEYTMDPCRESTYEIEAVKQYNPLYGVLKESFNYASTLADADVPYISSKLNDIMELYISEVLNDNISFEEALGNMEKDFLTELDSAGLMD